MCLSVELTFYGGRREIGGTKILLKTSRGAVFLDFGKSFDLEGKYFDEWNPPFYIPSLIQIGALPDIEGLYRMKPGRPVDGVIISHPHQDHVGHVPLPSPEIPIYAGADTAELIRIRNETYNHNWQNDYSQRCGRPSRAEMWPKWRIRTYRSCQSPSTTRCQAAMPSSSRRTDRRSHTQATSGCTGAIPRSPKPSSGC